MPRNVRNFWLELDVDGKKTPVATGPCAKDGGFELRVKMRNKGEVTEGPLLVGSVNKNGVISLRVHDNHYADADNQVAVFKTRR